jgi:hypothetical protein
MALVVVLAIGLLVFESIRSGAKVSNLRGQLEKTEAALAEAEGAAIASRESQRALLNEADRLQQEIADMAAALGKQPKVREVIRWKTGDPVVVYQGEPAPADQPECPDCPPVAVEVSGVTTTLETDAGTVAVLGKVLLKRTSPPPPELFEVPFSAETEAFVAKEPPRPPRWYLGPAAAIQDGRAAFGAAAIGPPLRVWRVEARPVFQAVSDSQGAVTASAALVFGLGRP